MSENKTLSAAKSEKNDKHHVQCSVPTSLQQMGLLAFMPVNRRGVLITSSGL